MSGLLLLRRRAKRDLLELAWYIAQDNARAAERFLDAAEKAFTELLKTPGMGASRTFRNPRLKGIRMRPIPGFAKVLIFYRPLGRGIEIIRVLHGARDIPATFENE